MGDGSRIALIFDLDGTLAETRKDIAASANFAMRAVGAGELPEAVITSYVGDGAPKLIERCLGEKRHLLQDALQAWRAHYERNLLNTTRLYPGVAETLESLPGPLAVLTNKPESMSLRILDGLGIAKRFHAVIGGDSLPVRKPDPAGVRAILERTDASRAVLIGDSRIDVETARAAGATCWGAAYGFEGREALAKAGADTVFEKFEEIVELRRTLA